MRVFKHSVPFLFRGWLKGFGNPSAAYLLKHLQNRNQVATSLNLRNVRILHVYWNKSGHFPFGQNISIAQNLIGGEGVET